MKPSLNLVLVLGLAAANTGHAAVGGSYAEGEFRLPDMKDPLDAYVITVEEAGKAPRQLRLPAGVTKFTLAEMARPAAGFQWRFVRMSPNGAGEAFTPFGEAAVAVLEPHADKPVPLVDGQLRLRWRRVPGANSYELSLLELPELPGAKPKKEELKQPGEKDPWKYLSDLTPGHSYRWGVKALTEGQVIAQAESEFTVAQPWYGRAKDAGWRLQRAETLIETDKKAEAATIGFARDVAGNHRYNTEFALIYAPPLPIGSDSWAANLKASFEARLNSSGDAKKSDALRLRLGGEVDTSSSWLATYSSIAAKYETDRAKTTEKVLLEILTTPTIGPLGRIFPDSSTLDDTGRIATEPPVEIRPRVFVGLDVGDNRKVGTSGERAGNILRWVGRVRLEVASAWLTRALAIDSTLLYLDGTGRFLQHEDSARWNRVLSSGVDFGITENVALALRYNVGRDAPKFQWDRLFSTSIGVKF